MREKEKKTKKQKQKTKSVKSKLDQEHFSHLRSEQFCRLNENGVESDMVQFMFSSIFFF